MDKIKLILVLEGVTSDLFSSLGFFFFMGSDPLTNVKFLSLVNFISLSLIILDVSHINFRPMDFVRGSTKFTYDHT